LAVLPDASEEVQLALTDHGLLLAGRFGGGIASNSNDREKTPMPVTVQDRETSVTERGDISDETLNRLLRWVLIGLASLIGLGGAIGGVRWAASKLISPPPLTVVDLGFLQDMIDHHEQALAIAHAYLANNPNGDAAPYASEVILYQERDLKRMDRFLHDGGQKRGDPKRLAMTWMGAMEHGGMVMPAEGVPVSQMPGMQPLARIQELEKLQGKDAERLFFQLMTDHHKGGIEMAMSASSTASRKAIRAFAAYVVNGQGIEIVEYSQAVTRLGL
jgi:uncharacterized protein (DUF305 family)